MRRGAGTVLLEHHQGKVRGGWRAGQGQVMEGFEDCDNKASCPPWINASLSRMKSCAWEVSSCQRLHFPAPLASRQAI